ncbi:MAG TPA: AAA family ATPase [Anaerolineales bacterium]|nr:AAA family ATPase [Anaerolineales bacterium]
MSEGVQSLTELLQRVSSRRFLEGPSPEPRGLADNVAFPFLGLVGQNDMKLALLLGLINSNIGGVLLIGPRGTGKTTAVRSLADLLPEVARSRCAYGCLPEEIQAGGLDAVCPDCARRYGQGEPLTYEDRVRLIELPLNARLDDVIGGIDERAAVHKRLRVNLGILARADRNLLYIDEVNLLGAEIIDAILDAASQGTYSVQRGPVSAVYWSRFILIGSMNPEEGRLRPQILDRFGLRVIVKGLEAPEERLEAYRRSLSYRQSPRQMIESYSESTEIARQELQAARKALPEVGISPEALKLGMNLIQSLSLDSLRAEITLFEAARAHAVADGRSQAEANDIRTVAPMALRLRRSEFIERYLALQSEEGSELNALLNRLHSNPSEETDD